MKKNKLKITAALLMSSSLLLASSASAFSDVKGKDSTITEALQKKGIVQGVGKDKFAPHGKLTGAEGVYMIIKALGLKETNDASSKKYHQFKQPWYSEVKAIAEDNGIKLPEKFSWNSELTKEQFAYILDQAVNATGNYPLIKIFIDVKDADQGNVLYSGSIQRLLVMKITELDDKGKFYPTASMTRIEAARMVYNAAQFVEKQKELEQQQNNRVSYAVTKVNDQVNKVVLTRYEQPHPGYGIRVAKVEFTKDSKAVIHYELLSPDPDMVYPQVITDSQTETYISSDYSIEIKEVKETQ